MRCRHCAGRPDESRCADERSSRAPAVGCRSESHDGPDPDCHSLAWVMSLARVDDYRADQGLRLPCSETASLPKRVRVKTLARDSSLITREYDRDRRVRSARQRRAGVKAREATGGPGLDAGEEWRTLSWRRSTSACESHLRLRDWDSEFAPLIPRLMRGAAGLAAGHPFADLGRAWCDSATTGQLQAHSRLRRGSHAVTRSVLRLMAIRLMRRPRHAGSGSLRRASRSRRA